MFPRGKENRACGNKHAHAARRVQACRSPRGRAQTRRGRDAVERVDAWMRVPCPRGRPVPLLPGWAPRRNGQMRQTRRNRIPGRVSARLLCVPPSAFRVPRSAFRKRWRRSRRAAGTVPRRGRMRRCWAAGGMDPESRACVFDPPRLACQMRRSDRRTCLAFFLSGGAHSVQVLLCLSGLSRRPLDRACPACQVGTL